MAAVYTVCLCQLLLNVIRAKPYQNASLPTCNLSDVGEHFRFLFNMVGTGITFVVLENLVYLFILILHKLGGRERVKGRKVIQSL
jgi:hypothetical protein